jgi:hypothetical protein
MRNLFVKTQRVVKENMLIYKIISVFGLFFLVDVIWAAVTLHDWIFICSVVAVFQILTHLKKLKNNPKL